MNYNPISDELGTNCGFMWKSYVTSPYIVPSYAED